MKARTLRSVIDEGLDRYAAVFVPGGQAPVVDLMQDPDVGTILRHFHEHQKPTALLCHGPIALAAAMPAAHEFRAALIASDKARAAELAKGWPYAGCRMTIFSATEEPHVIEDGEPITGQNPRSDHPIATKLIAALERAGQEADRQEVSG